VPNDEHHFCQRHSKKTQERSASSFENDERVKKTRGSSIKIQLPEIVLTNGEKYKGE